MAETTPEAPEIVDNNCVGTLVQLPSVPGTTFNRYQCATCGQIVHVGFEDEAANGLPPEHAPA